MLRICLAFLLGVVAAPAKTTLTIAAAANLAHVIEPLTAAYRSEHPGIKTEITLGSSGSLVAQITHGAPFDLFLSADLAYPRALVARGSAEAATLIPFTEGRLVLWTTRTDISLTDPASALRDPHWRKLAIANPDTAPYGRAALEVIAALQLNALVESKIVVGENVSQTAQFVSSGNADLGFVAMSLLRAPALRTKGHWIEIPSHLHSPLTQGAVVTNRGSKKPAAHDFLRFLQSPEARKIFARFGYRVPAVP